LEREIIGNNFGKNEDVEEKILGKEKIDERNNKKNEITL
jgi:hypothetical protein